MTFLLTDDPRTRWVSTSPILAYEDYGLVLKVEFFFCLVYLLEVVCEILPLLDNYMAGAVFIWLSDEESKVPFSVLFHFLCTILKLLFPFWDETYCFLFLTLGFTSHHRGIRQLSRKLCFSAIVLTSKLWLVTKTFVTDLVMSIWSSKYHEFQCPCFSLVFG